MDSAKIQKLQKEYSDLYDTIADKVDGEVMSMVNKLVDLEVELEKLCNQ